MTSGKILILFTLAAFMLVAGCSNPKNGHYNPWNIADNDSLYLGAPQDNEGYQISGALFKAINPRFIANVYGFSEYGVNKNFELVSFDGYITPNYDGQTPLTSLNARKKWNYYINDKLARYYSRVLISAFLLQAFEKVEYIEADSTKRLFAWGMPVGVKSGDSMPDETEQVSRDGSIRVYIRDISKSVINDKTTIYLINNRVVTRKIYEAINPVYIRSLKRITDKSELVKYKQEKNIKEIVEVELFTYFEFLKNNTSKGGIWISLDDRPVDCPDCHKVYLVDNVQIDSKIYDALRGIFFKKYCEIYEDEKEAFEPYRKLFPEKNLEFKKNVTIISL